MASVRWKRLPAPVKNAVWRVAETLDGPNRLLYRARTRDHRPVPPLSIRGHVGPFLDPGAFLESGRAVVDGLERVLDGAGFPLGSRSDVLDLACGPGRVIMHLVERHPTLRITGCDVDARSIAWSSRHLAGATFVATPATPPLPFAEGSFDLVFSYSLWTHLSEADQLRWLAEVRRLLRPDGVGVLTTHGVGIHRWMTTAPEAFVESRSFMERLAAAGGLAEHGFLFVPYSESAVSGPGLRGIAGDYGLSFQTPEYTRATWSDQVDVLDVVVDGIAHQDAVVIARR